MKTEPIDPACTPERGKGTSSLFDVNHSDSLLASDWLDHGSSYVKEPIIMTDAIASLLGDDLGNEYKQMTPTSSQGWGFGSCAWNNMPAVCQISELP